MANPNVVYDFEAREIDVELVVEKNGAGEPNLVAALPVLRPGAWTVVWTLKGVDDLSPIFDFDAGINITGTPPDLDHDDGQRVSDTQFRMTFENSCDSANAANYCVNFHFPPNVNGVKKRFHHDPTISVVTDPPAP